MQQILYVESHYEGLRQTLQNNGARTCF